MKEIRYAEITPPGAGAISVTAVRGPNAWQIAQKIFRPLSPQGLPAHPTKHQCWFGHCGSGPGDEAMLMSGPSNDSSSFEIHSHGGKAVCAWIHSMLDDLGCQASTAEVVLAAHDAWVIAAKAPTLRTASIAIDQANGAFARSMRMIQAALARSDQAHALKELRMLCQRAPVGQHLIEPWNLVIAGATNVGKSSLMNQLAGYQRCIVTPIPGTTRDVVTLDIAFNGWPVRLHDTAGFRQTSDALETEGMQRALTILQQSDLCLFLIDATEDTIEKMFHFMNDNQISPTKIIPVFNKIDLLPSNQRPSFNQAVAISATLGQGIDFLIKTIVDKLVPFPLMANDAVPYTERCYQLINMTIQLIEQSFIGESIELIEYYLINYL